MLIIFSALSFTYHPLYADDSGDIIIDSTHKKSYKNESHTVAFIYLSEEISFPAACVVEMTTSASYTINSDSSYTITRVDGFISIDSSLYNTVEAWSPEYDTITSLTIDNTEFLSNKLQNESGVLVSPTWIWDAKYKNLSIWKAKNVDTYVASNGSLVLSGECLPMVHNNIITSFDFNNNGIQ